MIDFKNDPDILSNMRICLEGIARIKGVKLQHPLEKYDMDVMLNMMKEMETLPVKRSFKGKIVRFKDSILAFIIDILIYILRKCIFLIGWFCGGEVKIRAEKLLKE